MSWLDNYSTTNTFRSIYINGFIDISGGRLQTRSSTDGHLMIAGDASLNGNLYVGGDISWNPNSLANNSIPSSAIIGGVGGSTGLDTDADLSLNKRLFVGEDVSLNQSLFVARDSILGGIYNKPVSFVVQLAFGNSPTTTDLGDFGGFNIYNQPTTNGGTATIHNGSDSHIGEAVAISDDGTIVAIGAPQAIFHSYNRLGYVEIKQYSNGSWSRIGLLIGNNTLTNPKFGKCVALNGDGTILAVGTAALIDSVQKSIVQVYEYDGSSWSQLGADISDITNWTNVADKQGTLSFNTAGTILAIGDRRANSNVGMARVYEYSSGSWSQIGADIGGEGASDYYGTVSLNSSGSILAVGAQYNDDAGSNAGHVRVFEYSGGSWSQLGSDIDGEAAGDESGFSVSMDGTGTIVAIGATGNDDGGNGAGHVRVYQYSSGSWSQLGSDIDGEGAGDKAGASVSINSGGNTVLIGFSETFDYSGDRTGYVKMYYYNSGSWTQVGDKQVGTHSGDNAGVAVALSKNDSIALYGASWYSTDIVDGGSAHIFQVESTAVQIVDTYALTRGLVGIGITNPSYEVDISGTMQVSGDISASRLYVSGDISWNPTSLANDSIPSSAIIGGVRPDFMLFESQDIGSTNGVNFYDMAFDVYGTANFLADNRLYKWIGTRHGVGAYWNILNFNPGFYRVSITGRFHTADRMSFGFDTDADGTISFPNGFSEEPQSLHTSDDQNFTYTFMFKVQSVQNFNIITRNIVVIHSNAGLGKFQLLFERLGYLPSNGQAAQSVSQQPGTNNSIASSDNDTLAGSFFGTNPTKPTNSDETIDLNGSGTEWFYRVDPTGALFNT